MEEHGFANLCASMKSAVFFAAVPPQYLILIGGKQYRE